MKTIFQNHTSTQFKFASPLETLLSIKRFGINLDSYSERIQKATNRLWCTYEKACELIDLFGQSTTLEKKWQIHLNEVIAQAKSINYDLKVINLKTLFKDQLNFQELWSNYDTHKMSLEKSALELERLGTNVLIEERKGFWHHEVCIYKKAIAPEINRNESAEKLLTQLLLKYDQKTIEKLLEVISDLTLEHLCLKENEREYLYIDTCQKIQKEFNHDPQLWQIIKRTLRGDICPTYFNQYVLQKNV